MVLSVRDCGRTGALQFLHARSAGTSGRENGDPEDFGWHNYEKESQIIRRRRVCSLFRKRYSLYSFAVPVFSGRKHLLGALGVYTKFLPDDQERFILENLWNTAGELNMSC